MSNILSALVSTFYINTQQKAWAKKNDNQTMCGFIVVSVQMILKQQGHWSSPQTEKTCDKLRSQVKKWPVFVVTHIILNPYLTHWTPGRYGSNFKSMLSTLILLIDDPVKMPSSECHRPALMVCIVNIGSGHGLGLAGTMSWPASILIHVYGITRPKWVNQFILQH